MKIPTVILSLTLLCAARTATAQELVYLLGDEALNNSDFGRAVGDAGDVDGDGTPDVIVGAPFYQSRGAVFVYSGRTGDLIWWRLSENLGDAFGWSVDGIGDIDGDGKSEVIVGAPLWDNNNAWPNGGGRIYILRGSGGTFHTTISSSQLNGQLGTTVRGLGDITGDGIGDFAFGSPYYDDNGLVDNGEVTVYSGAGTSFLWSRNGANNGDYFGFSLDIVRATGAQATSRLVIGEPRVDGAGVDRGQARLFDGFGNTMSFFAGTTNNEWFGHTVAGLGDVNNDGWEDYAFSAPYIDLIGVGTDCGRVRIYSGASTSLLFTANGKTAGALFGFALAGFGDMNGDGRDDVLIGGPNDDTGTSDGGEVRVVSGANGLALASWYGGVNDHAGRAVSAAGDLNGDGLGDFIWGANDAPFGAGQAQVHLSGLGAPTIYCVGKLNTAGCVPSISTEGVASLSIADNFHVRAQDVLNNKFGLLFWGSAPANTPFQGATLCVQSPLTRTTPQLTGGNAGPDDCSGAYDFHFSQSYMALSGITAGSKIHGQVWYRDPADAFGSGLSNAVAFDVVP